MSSPKPTHLTSSPSPGPLKLLRQSILRILRLRRYSKGKSKQKTLATPTNNPILTLPPLATLHLSYLAEGAANIIYRISSSPSSPPLPDSFPPNHLLRLRKALPSGASNLSTFHALQTVFFTLFPTQYTLDTRLIKISRDLIDRQNEQLKQMELEGKRASKRAGLYLVGPPPSDGEPSTPSAGLESEIYEHYGFLVEDMSPSSSSAEPNNATQSRQVLVEFKPKWLLQSPSAPKTARRCRTCALRLSKDYKKSKNVVLGNGTGMEEGIGKGHWCPLDLGSGEPDRVRRAIRGILASKGAVLTGWGGKDGQLSEDEKKALEEKVFGFFDGKEGREFIAGLRKLQGELDTKGPVELFGEEIEMLGGVQTPGRKELDGRDGDGKEGEWGLQWREEVRRFLMAMTVRDLTLFMKVDLFIPSPGRKDVDAVDRSMTVRIGDLDLKSPSNGKAAYWVNLERKLADGGWYNGTESGVAEGRKSGVVEEVERGVRRMEVEAEESEVLEGVGDTGERVVLQGVQWVGGTRMEEGASVRSEENIRWCI